METQITISDWAISTFGHPASAKKIVERFVEEVIELDTLSAATPPDIQKVKDECADCLIVLYQVANVYGFNLNLAVNDKMRINRNREWELRGDGTAQHK